MITSYFFFFYCYADHRELHSFPTRRSSDLELVAALRRRRHINRDGELTAVGRPGVGDGGSSPRRRQDRSEEHTSELQSHHELVCRLLLEKKKNKNNT